MRVAFLVGRFPALSETFILSQITGMIDRGHDIRIFARQADQGIKVHPDVGEYDLLEKTVYLPSPPAGRWRRLADAMPLVARFAVRHPLAAARLLADRRPGRGIQRMRCAASLIDRGAEKFDVLHCHFGHNGLAALPLRRLGALGGRMITSFHGHDVHVYPRLHGTGVYRALFRASDLFTANSRFTAGCLEALGCPPDRIRLLPVGLPVDEFPFHERTLTAGEPVRLLSVARLTEKKGLVYALRAFARVAGSRPSCEYHIVGDGPLRATLEQAAAGLGLAGKVRFHGWMTREELRARWRESHLFILPSVTAEDGDAEGQGLVLQEAQASGLPVLATLHNGFPDSILDGESGYLVPERDVDALAGRLTQLVDDPGAWPRMGRRGSAFVRENFDIGALNRRLEGFYAELVPGARLDRPVSIPQESRPR